MSELHTPDSARRAPSESSGDLDSGHLGRSQLIALSLSSFVPAVGMALVPMLMFTAAGITAWPSSLLAMVSVISVGLAVTHFARRYISTGSLYSYVGEVFGPWARYLTAASLLAGFILQVATVAGIVGIFLGSFLVTHGVESALGVGVQATIYALAVGIAAWVAFRGLDTSVRIAVTLAAISVPVVACITVGSALHTGLDLSQQFAFASFTFNGTFQGVAAGAAFLVAFESCTSLAAETRDPKRNVPLAVMAVPVILGALYLVCTILQVPGLSRATESLAAGMSPTTALASQAGMWTWVSEVSDLVLAVAAFAALIGFTNYGARFLLTMSEDGLLPKTLAAVHHRHRSPHVSIAILSILGFLTMAVLVFIVGDVTTAYNAMATLLVYLWVPAYLMITAGAIALSIRERDWQPALLLGSFIGFVSMLWVYVNGIVNPPASPNDAMSWVALVVLVVLFIVLSISAATARRSSQAHPTQVDPHGTSSRA
ncbi:APC family permease [Mycolicibacterium wolinskyi]|uniref:Amino acid transporter n=1 Tax=Mycolicibacterium wolinskyi TaxID=59750 RepID=A0A1X2F213_9MYCO|nr:MULTISPECIES: APC family permease [Mycolicibacterium]MCV7287816.1 APC family permease [Mycolicibacterium wolinskyi]MCV7294714.1 APC family permease [Mycolicibacterium goodii]ORX12425.1 amino acid transporter [Mycolicibacterium wolinskyi]